jgi:hypothetical protein
MFYWKLHPQQAAEKDLYASLPLNRVGQVRVRDTCSCSFGILNHVARTRARGSASHQDFLSSLQEAFFSTLLSVLP